jgi:RNA polymerase sigma factor (sigma-70 family)
MTNQDLLAEHFEGHRGHLEAVAFRMLGSRTEADDAVQEAWLRLSRSNADEIANLGGWLTTVVSRICLDMLRTRTSRREDPVEEQLPDLAPADSPEHQALLADAMGPALLVVLDKLGPSERIAFVLHDLFGLSFDEIAPVVGRSAAAARQMASRARRRIRGAEPDSSADHRRRRAIVAAFLKASRDGEFDALLALLDPDVVLTGDATVVAMGADAEVHGADAVARIYNGRARAARLALLDGEPGGAWLMGGELKVLWSFTIVDERITAITLLADPQTLAATDLDLDVVPHR